MPIDTALVGVKTSTEERSWTPDDCMLYALAVGAGVDELAFVTEDAGSTPQAVLPTFGTLAAAPVPGTHLSLGNFDPAMLLHAGYSLTIVAPGATPVSGSVTTETTITGVYDKASGALVVTESESLDPASGAVRYRASSSLFIRGEGGWGGDRGPAMPTVVSEDRPDAVVTYETSPDQALIYRLCGDRNPLHYDHDFAQRAGFKRPILHGLCTFGFTGRAILHTFCESDPARLRSIEGWFPNPVYPGDLLTVAMWEREGGVAFRTETQRGDVVLEGGYAAII